VSQASIEAVREVAADYSVHYSEHCPSWAFELYRNLAASHSSAPEVGYARAQILSVRRLGVPDSELLEVEAELARVHFENRSSAAFDLLRAVPAARS